MLDPIALFSYESHIDQRTIRADTLLVTLGSFVDAGHTQRILDEHLLNTLPNRLLGHFDADQVYDYAGHRPLIVFDRNHFERYRRPTISLHAVTDASGRTFLLLRGPEPSFQWERMASAVQHLLDQHGVERTILAQAIPSATPHTRDVAVTRFASDPDLLDEEPVLGAFQMSSSFTALLTQRLGEAGRDAIGLTAHVPHYLAETDVPGAAVAILRELAATAGVEVPAGELQAAHAAMIAQVDEQVAASGELAAVVGQLERQYDAVAEGRRRITAAARDLPSADEIGQQAEDFLRGLGESGDDVADDDSSGDDEGGPPH